MYLFIFESIGTSELLLIGVVALMFLGPRRMPEMARKLGKIMSEFRGTANEFKETWQREVNFEEEAKALDLNNLEAEPVAREVTAGGEVKNELAAPAIKEVDASVFDNLPAKSDGDAKVEAMPASDPNDKANWL